MVVNNLVVMDDKVLEMLQEVLKKENAKKPKNETLTIRILPEEIALYQHYVNLTPYKNISEMVRQVIRERIEKIRHPANPVEKRFIEFLGIHRKISKTIEKHGDPIFNEVEKVAEIVEKKGQGDFDIASLIEFVKHQHAGSMVALSLIQKLLTE